MKIDILKKSREFAEKAHGGQKRKSSGKPYIIHPIKVSQILRDAGMSIEVQIAGYNHDTVEDTNITIEDIRREFGDYVAHLVSFNTEDKNLSWEERKHHTIEQLRLATLDEKALVVADKYANLLELIEQYEIIGEKTWDRFKRGKEKQYWYFSGVAKSALENLRDEMVPKFFLEYTKTVEEFFNRHQKHLS